MTSKAKWLTAAIAAVLWIAWGAAYAAWKTHPDIGVGHVVATEVLRAAAGLMTVVLILGFLVSPVIATARVWKEIGIKEQQNHCDACRHAADRAARYGNIIPIRFDGAITSARDSARDV